MKKILLLLSVLFSMHYANAQFNCNFTQLVSGNNATFTHINSQPLIYTVDSVLLDFGDGNSMLYNTPPIPPLTNHTYATSGVYNACILQFVKHIASNTTFTCSYCDSVYINNTTTGCFALASFVPTGSGSTINFNNSSTCVSCSTSSYFWNFGDGNTSTAVSPTHTYAAPGNYTVCLQMVGIDSSNNPCLDTFCTVVNISATTNCMATLNKTVSGSLVQFNTTVTGGTPSYTYSYNFGDGSPIQTGPFPNVNHNYANPGLYNACVTVTDSLNNTCTSCDSVFINPTSGPCFITAGFSNTISGNTANFFNTTNCTNCVSTTYQWSFGDGNTSTAVSPTHTYALPGTYNVCLYATGTDSLNNTCVDSFCTNVTVSNTTGCNAGLSHTLSGNTANFIATVTGGVAPYSYTFLFGDGSPSVTNSTGVTSHTYTATGAYGATVIVTDSNNNNCVGIDSVFITNTSSGCIATANFGSSTTGLSVNFNNASTCNGCVSTSYFWSFGDGNTSTANSPTHTYANSGTYNVCLVVSGLDSLNNACTDSICQFVSVGNTTAGCNASASFTEVITGLNANFTNTSSISNGTIISNAWTFGDGNASTTVSPSHTYINPGVYTVTLVVTGIDSINNLCSDTLSKVIFVGSTIPGNCIVNASFSESISGLTASFTDNSTITGGTIANHAWSFGDGNTSSLQNPSHIYAAAGTYTVYLVVSGIDSLNNTCIDSFSKSIMVGPSSVNNVNVNSLTIYPNPTSQSFIIELPANEKMQDLVISDVSGRVIQKNFNVISNKKLQIDLKSNAAGIYFIKLLTDKHFYTSTISKQE